MSRRKHPKLPRSFVALDRRMLRSPEWRKGLRSSAKVVYIHLRDRCVGWNNGEIMLKYKDVADFMHPATFSSALKQLEAQGWIEKTMLGGLERHLNKFRLTGKYDLVIANYRY